MGFSEGVISRNLQSAVPVGGRGGGVAKVAALLHHRVHHGRWLRLHVGHPQLL